MADEASNQRHKRCHADESADQLATSPCQEVRTRNRPGQDQRMSSKKLAEVVKTLVETLNKRKRQRLNKVGSSRPAEWHKAMAKELNAKPYDPDATDKSDIEQWLQSGSSILVLKSTPSRRSHCRALLCLRHKLTGIINIESDYRFNLKDLTGTRAGDLTHHLQPNRFYHVTCLEHILSLHHLDHQRRWPIRVWLDSCLPLSASCFQDFHSRLPKNVWLILISESEVGKRAHVVLSRHSGFSFSEDNTYSDAASAVTWWKPIKYVNSLGADDPMPQNLAYTWRQQGRYDEAERFQAEVLELYKEVLGAKHPHTITGMANLVDCAVKFISRGV